MAEFKLGRIRFIWKNDWLSATDYFKDDIVKYGGNMYVCIQGHTSTNDFIADLASVWNKISEGQDWKGNWSTSTSYKENDVVKYGGLLYIVNEGHVSSATNNLGLEADQSKWDLYAEGFDWKDSWSTNTRYKINDVVKYNSTVYVCVEEHVSATTNALGLEIDQSKWNIFSKGLEWTGEWAITTRYRVNDIVKYGGQIYVCNQGHTSSPTISLGLEQDNAKWDSFHKGIEFKGNWTNAVRYKSNDLVSYGGGVWICTIPHTSQSDLTNDESKWTTFVEGLQFEDTWQSTTRYQKGDLVTYGGYSFIAITNNLGIIPTQDETAWSLFVTGFNFRGSYAEDSTAQDYRVGDVVRVGGYTYLCVKDHLYDVEIALNPSYSGYRPPNSLYWEVLNEGIFWKDQWTDTSFYDAGDAVRFGDSSYICILAHTSDQTALLNRPDQANAATVWNLLSGGPENNVMTTDGDLVFYSGVGPTRLPIGLPGQVLAVNSTATAPEWKYLGAINNIFYVEPNTGQDLSAPVYGVSLDQPWKTIGYAAEQIEKGALRPNARLLVELNKALLQDEAIEWAEAQIVAGTGIWTGFDFTDRVKLRSDLGEIVEALLWDISHNGNARSRLLTLSYFESGVLVASIDAIKQQYVEIINYLQTVISAVITNLDPAVKYGTLVQTKKPLLAKELDAESVIDNLLTIITTAITAENTITIPVELKANNSIFVKTGRLSEVLPIIVPENTAVIGDELRSTKIQPAGSLIESTDASFAISGLGNLSANLNALLSGNTANLTTFSGLVVDTTLSIANATVGAEAAGLINTAVQFIDWEINQNGTNPSIAGSNYPNVLDAYTRAVEIIEKNRNFLVQEVIGFIASSEPTYVYTQEEYSRNLNKYIDSVKFDLIYTGNYETLKAAKYYVNAITGSKLENMFLVRNGTGLRNCTVLGLDGRSDGNTIITDLDPALAVLGREYKISQLGNTDWNAFSGTVGITYQVGDIVVAVVLSSAGTTGRIDPTGLTGDNGLGTKRPVANAFVSLDPGFGPLDEKSWILNKSPYVQNVSTFGTACIGCKVDGYLHDSGNDSIVANDFTQLISDGIGYWVINLGRAELVSVFSYYAHIGYLAENGGKIRATNGNSSYGTFGTVAEGIDETEIPISGNVTNRAFDAIIDNVFTDGNNILVLQYLNAGQDYTSAATTINIEGEGFGQVIDNVTTRNGGVFEVRLLDLNETTDQFGGDGYITSTNVAQNGNSTEITLSNTDFATSGQYAGMAIYIIAGTGAGQYGYIDSYNSGTKLANILKDSDNSSGWDHVVPGTAIQSTLDNTTQYIIEPRISFSNPPSGAYADRAKARAVVEDEKIVKILILDPGAGYVTAPTLTITDPNNLFEAPTEVRIADGVLGQPAWTNRGTAFTTASATVSGDGFADIYQPGVFVQVENLSLQPQAGSNVTFASLPGKFFKLVVVRNFVGTPGSFSAQLQLSPELTISQAPEHLEAIEIRNRYSQVRLTGHDFLDIGTGNFEATNYPEDPFNQPDPEKETVESAGGRVFFTSTDQDGNFRVGGLFSVEQSTGIATLNADAFNISGLQELSLGELGLGSAGATITEFSTDGTFSANSDNIVPTQKAIRTFITSQIGGGAATLNVNSVTAGQVRISGRQITTTNERQIDVDIKLNLKAGVVGVPIAMNYFLNS